MNGRGLSLGEKIEWRGRDLLPGEYPGLPMLGAVAFAREGVDADRAALRERLKALPDELVQELHASREAAAERKKGWHGIVALALSTNAASVECSLDWAQDPAWTTEDATALSLGLDPQKVTEAWVNTQQAISSFCEEYRSRLRRFRLAHELGDLGPPAMKPRPVAVLEWCRAKGMEFYKPLAAAVAYYGPTPLDWRARAEACEQNAFLEQSRLSLLLMELQQAAGSDTCEALRTEIDRLLTLLRATQDDVAQAKADAESSPRMGSKKIGLALLIEHYGLDNKLIQKLPSFNAITADIDGHIHGVSRNTVSSFFRDAFAEPSIQGVLDHETIEVLSRMLAEPEEEPGK